MSVKKIVKKGNNGRLEQAKLALEAAPKKEDVGERPFLPGAGIYLVEIALPLSLADAATGFMF